MITTALDGQVTCCRLALPSLVVDSSTGGIWSVLDTCDSCARQVVETDVCGWCVLVQVKHGGCPIVRTDVSA